MTKISKCYRVTLIKRKVIKFVITKKKYKYDIWYDRMR